MRFFAFYFTLFIFVLVYVFSAQAQDTLPSLAPKSHLRKHPSKNRDSLREIARERRASRPEVPVQLDELVVLGTRGSARTFTESPVAVDVLDISKMIKEVPQPDMGSMLNYSVPSFMSTNTSQQDGTDNVDAAALRGLAPDQTLVLINGKRRHTGALVNVNPSFGRGSVSTDLNAIPAMAVGKIEVLRDGAAAQYGSDAVAGVINIELKKTKGTNIIVTAGSQLTRYETYTEASKGNYLLGEDPRYVKRTAFDGQVYQIGINHGLALGKKGGFLNLTGAFNYRGATNRAGEPTGSITNNTTLNTITNPADIARDQAFLAREGRTRMDYRNRFGQSELLGGQFFINASIPVGKVPNKSEFYFFGGTGFRAANSAGQFRKPGNPLVVLAQYPNGFLPLINAKIWDGSLALGYRTTEKKWNIDLSNVIGVNSYRFDLSHTENPTAAGGRNEREAGALHIDSTQSSFYAGTLAFIQNTASLDISRNFPLLKGLNVAFGTAYRYEKYIQKAGETASWANYNRRAADQPNVVDLQGETTVENTFASPDPLVASARNYTNPGAQIFAGFSPETALAKHRHNIAFYVDLEQHFTKAFLLNAAGRYEYYSDFGHNFSWKIASRLKVSRRVSLRAAVSTSFRAPSLAQRHLFKVNSITTSGIQQQRGSFPNDSQLARELGIGALKPEISLNASGGITFNFRHIKITGDFYYIRIRNRIIYTGTLQATGATQAILNNFDVDNATFFVNGLNTRTLGADLVFTYKIPLARPHKLQISLTGNWSRSSPIGAPLISDHLKGQAHRFLNPNALGYLFEAFPHYKSFLLVQYSYKKWSFFVRQSMFGSAMHIDDNANTFYRKLLPDGSGRVDSSAHNLYVYRQRLAPTFPTDISISYDVFKYFRITLGVNNIFDLYPEPVSARKGRFYEIQANPNLPNYNKVATHGVSAKELNWMNDDILTVGMNMGNQYTQSRSVSIYGVGGRYLFLRLLFQF